MPRKTVVAAAEPPPRRRRATKSTPQSAVSTQDIQADVEGVPVDDDSRKVEFMGETFLMAESVGLMPLLKFAHASSGGLDSTDMRGLAAMYAMISDCIDQTQPEEGQSEWQRFEQHAIEAKAQAEDLMKLVQVVIERLAARPSQPPGDSSAGRPKTSQNLRALPSLPGTQYPGLEGMDGMMSVQDLDRLT